VGSAPRCLWACNAEQAEIGLVLFALEAQRLQFILLRSGANGSAMAVCLDQAQCLVGIGRFCGFSVKKTGASLSKPQFYNLIFNVIRMN
jgi:hypothetical protein